MGVALSGSPYEWFPSGCALSVQSWWPSDQDRHGVYPLHFQHTSWAGRPDDRTIPYSLMHFLRPILLCCLGPCISVLFAHELCICMCELVQSHFTDPPQTPTPTVCKPSVTPCPPLRLLRDRIPSPTHGLAVEIVDRDGPESRSPLHPRFVSYHHLLGFFPRFPLLWRGPFPTVAAHRDPSEILSGLEAPLNQPVQAADARSHHPLSSIRGRSLGIRMPGGELLLLYWVAHLWWGGQGAGLSILVLLWSVRADLKGHSDESSRRAGLG